MKIRSKQADQKGSEREVIPASFEGQAESAPDIHLRALPSYLPEYLESAG